MLFSVVNKTLIVKSTFYKALKNDTPG